MLYDRYSAREIRDAARKWGWTYHPNMGKGGHAVLTHSSYPSVVMSAVGRKGGTHPAILKKLTQHQGVTVEQFMAGPPKSPTSKEKQMTPTLDTNSTATLDSYRGYAPDTVTYALLEAITHGANNVTAILQYLQQFTGIEDGEILNRTAIRHRLNSVMKATMKGKKWHTLNIKYTPGTRRTTDSVRWERTAYTPKLPHGSWEPVVRKWLTAPTGTIRSGRPPKAKPTKPPKPLIEWQPLVEAKAKAPEAPTAALYERIGTAIDGRVLLRADDGTLYAATLDVFK